MLLLLFRGWLIGAYLSFEVVEARHAIVVEPLDSPLARIFDENERLGDIPKIVSARLLVKQMEPVQVAAVREAAGLSSTLSPQPQADVWLGFSKTKVEANCVVFTSILEPSR